MSDDQRDISARTILSAAWVVGSGFVTKGIDLVTLLVLARLLTPSDFGLVAIGMSLILLVETVLNLPVGTALLRLPDVTPDDLNTAFTLSALRGALLGLILVSSAVGFASVYGEPRLFALICVLAIAPVARGLTSPRMVEYSRRMSFQRDVAVEISGKLVAMTVATTTAFMTHSYWSIVAGTVATPVTMVVASYFVAPLWPRLSLSRWRLFSEFLGWNSASQMVTAINWQCDRLILARFIAADVLGAYSMANDLAVLPERTLIKTIMRPVMAAFTYVRDDPIRLRDAYAKTTAGAMTVGLPAMLGLALLAEPAVRCVLGGRWLVAVPLLKWLAYSSILPLFTAGLAPLAATSNSNRILFSLSLWELIIKIPLIFVGVVWFGLNGVVSARIFNDSFMTLISMALASNLIGISIPGQILSCWRILGAGAAMSAALLTLRPLLTGLDGPLLIVGLVLVGAVAMSAYCITIVGFWTAAGRPAGLEATLMRQIGAALEARGVARGG